MAKTFGGTFSRRGPDLVTEELAVVLSGKMMLRHLGWIEAADLILKGLNGAIAAKRVTYDFSCQMEGATEIKCSEFGENIVAHM